MSYRYGFDDQDLYVEKGTDRVPDDGKFYIVHAGDVVDSQPNAKRALARLQQVRLALATGDSLSEPDAKSKTLQAETVQRFMSQSANEKRVNRTRKGGKGR